MKNFLFALSFLTIFPINLKNINNEIFKNSLRYFPAVGLFIGIVLFLITFLNLPPDITSLLILLAWVVLSGGFHLDGVADIFDALGSLKDREKAFEIMQDSRIGAIGTIAIVLTLISKFVLIRNTLIYSPLTLILAPVCGRYAINFLSRNLDYAKDKGLGKFIVDNTDTETFIASSFFVLVVTLILNVKFVFILFFYYIFLLILTLFFYRKFRGVTGDMLGASVELSELFILFAGVCIAC